MSSSFKYTVPVNPQAHKAFAKYISESTGIPVDVAEDLVPRYIEFGIYINSGDHITLTNLNVNNRRLYPLSGYNIK